MRGQSRFQDDSKDMFRDVSINDAPHAIRMELIKRSVQDDIQRRTHTIVVIKGCYQPQGAPSNDMEGPLRLRVMPGNVGPVSGLPPPCAYPFCFVYLVSIAMMPLLPAVLVVDITISLIRDVQAGVQVFTPGPA